MTSDLVIRSSWTVLDGVTTRFGDKPRKRYSCSVCGKPGHMSTTCGREPKR
jgi:hypothetical protein